MKNLLYPVLYFMVLLYAACSTDGTDDPLPEPTPIATPGKVALSLPENNKLCEIGTVSGETASVSFSWNASNDTDAYDLSVINTNTNQEIIQKDITGTTAMVTLNRGHHYTWTVTSKNKGTEITKSDSWNFYLSGDGIQNAAPFAPVAVTPVSGAAVDADANQRVRLEWQGTDPDNDVLKYTLRIDTVDGQQPALASNANLTVTHMDVQVEPGQIYYWSVIASDGVISVNSDVFSFRVN